MENTRFINGFGRGPFREPGIVLIRFGLKTLLYRPGSEFACVGDIVFPTSKALSVSIPFSALEGDSTGLLLLLGPLDGPTLGETLSGSRAAVGNFKEGGARPLSDTLLSFGGVPSMLPYLVKPLCLGSSSAFSGSSSPDLDFFVGIDAPSLFVFSFKLFWLCLIASSRRSSGSRELPGSRPWLRFRNEYFGAVSNGEGVKADPLR